MHPETLEKVWWESPDKVKFNTIL